MKEIILLYYFDDQVRLVKMKRALDSLRVRVRVVEGEECGLPVGVLAGAEGVLRLGGASGGDGPRDEMMVFCGLSGEQLDGALAAVKRDGPPGFVFKAVMTPTNMHWNGEQLLAELKREHEAFKRTT